ncbi:MAG: NADPH2:quinone reductase [Chloroflexi bacterium]|nr:MAG: NADPH2:quinone reductase [Chloroflexota bacterium]
MKGIQAQEIGGPEVLKLRELPDPQPGEGEALLKLHATGVNFIDIYQRTGLYKLEFPYVPGSEAAGEVLAIGPGVSEVAVGDRVAYSNVLGAYAEQAVVASWRLVKIPDALDFKQAAALMLQGMTAHYLAMSVYPLKPGVTCLVHAAAGGVGLLLIQMAKRQGARVIGTVSTKEKASLAKSVGADEVILYTEDDFQAEVMRLTDRKGVEVAYDSVGATTYEKSLGSLAVRGMLALYGAASGPVPPINPTTLAAKSLFMTRPTLVHYTITREELLLRAGEVLGWAASGELKLHIGGEFPLSDAAEAHTKLAGRQTTGKLLLIP